MKTPGTLTPADYDDTYKRNRIGPRLRGLENLVVSDPHGFLDEYVECTQLECKRLGLDADVDGDDASLMAQNLVAKVGSQIDYALWQKEDVPRKAAMANLPPVPPKEEKAEAAEEESEGE